MRRRWERLRRRVPTWLGRAVLAVLVLGALAFGFYKLAFGFDFVTVTDSAGMVRTLLTTSREPDAILEALGVPRGQYDEVTYTKGGAGTAAVYIDRSFEARLTADGKTTTLEVVEGTVADMLAAAGVALEGEDYVEPAPETPLAPGLAATVHRVDYVEELRLGYLAEEEVDAFLQTLDGETSENFVRSRDGQYEVTWRDRLLDGLVVESVILSAEPIHSPIATRPLDSYTFETGVPNSRILGWEDIEVDENGIPINYTSVQTGMVSTAYSASRGRGSSGLGLYCGTVAVNPNKIPYGSRMYITSADGSFIYGYAIATDTGTAMMEGYVDIDLFFETNAECRRFGKRNMTVYFLGPETEETVRLEHPQEAGDEG